MVAKPSKIGKYDVIDVIGRGGMGVVYKANDPHLNRLVAIKMMTGGFAENPDLLKRFYREAQSTGNLQHPNIVTVYDLGDLEGNPYLVMEFLEGESLDAIINSHKALTVIAKINFICDVCHGLAYAHRQGIVHRDIKPANIMVLTNGNIKIVDFGIAHFGDKAVTRTGQLIGSLGYMSPEQVNGKAIDTRTDIFSTGVVLYQLLSYALPFDGDSTAATLLKIIHDPPPPLTKFVPDIPEDLEGVILRALAKDREDRYATVEDFGFELAQISDHLKQGLVAGHLREAESLHSRGLSHKAKELLLQVLKIDRQNTGAGRLLRTVQQSIEQEQIGVQLRQLRGQAEDAYASHQFDAALNYLGKALNLHPTDTGLQSLKSNILQAKAQADELQNLLHRAEQAYQGGELDVAKQVLEETLALSPNDLQAKALFRAVHREWEQRSRRAQVDSLVESARKDIASRRFTSALHVLKEAEALDPNAPEVKSLIASASAGREQERQRKELDSINLQIEEALDRDDFVSACQKIDEALLRFPENHSLLKLRALAEKQRQASERKQFIDDQLAQARTLIQAGHSEEVLKLLEKALQKVGSDPYLQSLRVIVRETVERERAEKRKAELLQRAKECLRRREFPEAITILEAANAEFQQEADLVDLLQFARDEYAVDKRRKATEAVVDQARVLIENDEYDKAVQLLESGLPEGDKEELGMALAEARNASTEYRKRLQGARDIARKLLQSRKAAEAVKFLESRPESFRRNPEYNELLQQACRDAGRWQNIEAAIEQSRQLSGQRKFDEAFRALEECRHNCGDVPELESAAAEIRDRRSAAATENLEMVIADCRMLMMAKQYRAVLDRLKPVAELAAVASSQSRGEFESLESQAAIKLVQQRSTEIERLLVRGEHLQAADLLRDSETEFPGRDSWFDLRKRLDEAVARRTEVQNLLQEARRLFSESSWKRGGEACLRAMSLAKSDPWLHEQAVETMLRAADAAVDSDWHSAESLVDELTRVKGGSRVPVPLRKRIADKKREAAIADALSEIRRLQASGDLQAALRTVGTTLISFADDPSLKALQGELEKIQRAQEEQAQIGRAKRQRLEYLNALDQRLERANGVEARIQILKEALRAYPDEALFKKKLADLHHLLERVAAQAKSAKNLEQAEQYAQAIAAWEEIKTLDPQFAGTESSLERLRGLQRQQRDARKEELIGQAQSALAAFDLDQLPGILATAKTEFPGDRQFLELERLHEERGKLRATALQFVAEGQKLFEKKNWERGLQSIQGSVEVQAADLPVRSKAVAALLQAAESALPADLSAAENLTNQAARLDPASSGLSKIRADVERCKRDAVVTQHLTSAQKLESVEDLEAALGQLKPALAAYPDEPRLLERRQMLETRLRAARAGREREKEILQHLEIAQRLHADGDFPAALARLNQGIALAPEDPRLLRMKGAVEKSIADAAELQRRQAERKREEEQQRLREEQKRLQEEERRQREAERQRREREEREASEESRRRAEAERLKAEALRRESGAEAATRLSPSGVPAPPAARSETSAMTSLNMAGWSEETLGPVVKHLASYVGPMARILVKRAAAQVTGLDELYVLLAKSLDRESERQAFLGHRPGASQVSAKTQSPRAATQIGGVSAPASPELTPAALEHAAHLLAPRVGPIAAVLVKKEAGRAQSLRSLYLLLAEHVAGDRERARFLRDAGVDPQSPAGPKSPAS